MRIFVLAAGLALVLATPALALGIPGEAPELPVETEQVERAIEDALAPEEPAGGSDPAPPESDKDPGFVDRVRDAMMDEVTAFSIAALTAIALTVSGFALVTRYISPKEALKNPQRAMLFGFVKATPGVHLKQLSEEFGMKTSSILWHIRKLESAELVKSERVNGYRVFYPVEGGIEIKRVSRALAALQNDNALRIYQHIHNHPGAQAAPLADRLDMHGGTARWHLRKLRDHGLLDELIQEDGSRFYPTPLGNRALEAREGRPVDAPKATPRPVASD